MAGDRLYIGGPVCSVGTIIGTPSENDTCCTVDKLALERCVRWVYSERPNLMLMSRDYIHAVGKVADAWVTDDTMYVSAWVSTKYVITDITTKDSLGFGMKFARSPSNPDLIVMMNIREKSDPGVTHIEHVSPDTSYKDYRGG